ncbi:MAG: hypothetical protein HY791_34935 [Deltaproteobacteria bacterium]|nr:hypothetical protein [Deltaproteobacteria bacterium]
MAMDLFVLAVSTGATALALDPALLGAPLSLLLAGFVIAFRPEDYAALYPLALVVALAWVVLVWRRTSERPRRTEARPPRPRSKSVT